MGAFKSAGHSRWALSSVASIFILTAIMFQNCGKGFETMEMVESSSLSPLAASPVISCQVGNQELEVGEFIEGYALTNATFPEVCGQKVKSICQEDGTLSISTPLSATCTDQCKAPDGSIILADGVQTFISYSLAGGTQTQCDSAKVVSKCTTSGMQPALGSHSTCKVDNNICTYPSGPQYSSVTSLMEGGTVTGYTMASATYPQLCGAQKTSTCQASGNWSGTTPLFKTCAQSCLDPFTKKASTAKIKWSAVSMAPTGACTFTESTCNLMTGTYSPSIPETASLVCSEVGPATITLSASSSEVSPGTEVQISFNVSADASEVKLTSNVAYSNIPSGGLTVGVSGSIKVKPTQTSTFTITAKNRVGTTSTKSITVTVKALPEPEPDPTPTGIYPDLISVTSRITSSAPANRPAYLVPTQLPSTKTMVMRITDSATMKITRPTIRHTYSKRQPWNSDGSLILLGYNWPGVLLDGKTFKFIKSINHPGDSVWSNLDPDLIYGVSGNSFVKLKVSTERQTTIKSFSNYKNLHLGGGEGNLSNDDRYAPLLGEYSGGVDVIIYDLVNNEVISSKSFPGKTGPYGYIDYAAMSPSGKYVLLAIDGGFELYDVRDMRLLRVLVKGQQSHADLGYDAEGREILLTSIDGQKALVSVRLEDGTHRVEVPNNFTNWSNHVSCRNNKRPGYCYISHYSTTNTYVPYMMWEVFAVKLDGSQRVERFAPATFSTAMTYERQAHAVPNRDGTQVIFASDWLDSSSNARIDTYVCGKKLNP